MYGVKGILASKTLWGGIIMLVAAIFRACGVEVGTDELTAVSGHVAELVGFIMIVWGRFTAKKDIKLPGKSAVWLLAIIILAMPGCALKGKPAHEQAMAISSETLTAYEALYKEYVSLRAALPEQRPFMDSNVAPVMDDAKLAIVSLSDATAAWVRLKIKPLSWDALYSRATKLIADATKLLARVKGGN